MSVRYACHGSLHYLISDLTPRFLYPSPPPVDDGTELTFGWAGSFPEVSWRTMVLPGGGGLQVLESSLSLTLWEEVVAVDVMVRPALLKTHHRLEASS